MDTKVTILQSRLDELKEAEAFLDALQAAGVDNWEGYEQAQEMME